MYNVLVVATSHEDMGDTGEKTGCWAEEIMAPILIFQEAGLMVTVASMTGGMIPIDGASLDEQFRTPEVDTFYANGALSDLLDCPLPLPKIAHGSDYDAVFVAGGHGACWDMPESAELQAILASAADAGSVVASVCHGTAALVNVVLKDGFNICKGKKVTGFSNSEEEAVGKSIVVPFLLEDRLKEAGGVYSKGEADWASHVVSDGNLVTGQNPASSKEVATAVVQLLSVSGSCKPPR